MPTIEHPNILFLLFDSLSAAQSKLLKNVQASHLRHLNRNCSIFTRVYAPCPESSPARASLFTGLDPCVHGLWSNGVTLRATEQTFAQKLSLAGYSNALVGRYQLSGVSGWTTEQFRPKEFAHTEWGHGPLHRSRQNKYLTWLQDVAPGHYAELFPLQAEPDQTHITHEQKQALEDLPNNLSFNYWVGNRLTHWIDEQPTNIPFLAIAGFNVGNDSGTEPCEDIDGESANLNALKQADQAIGKLLEQLESTNRLDDTAVIITAARGNIDTNEKPNLLKENSINVPLIISRAKQQQEHLIESPISTIDIAPTVLDMANVPTGSRTQGQSLLAVIDKKHEARGWAISRLRKNTNNKNNWQTALCTETMKLIVHHALNDDTEQSLQLYNMDTDILEQRNLAEIAEYAEEIERMIDEMIDARCAMEDRTEPRIAEF